VLLFQGFKKTLPDGIVTGAFANGFNTVKSPGGGDSEYRRDLTPEQYASICRSWVLNGCSIVGGCCGIFPEHIEAVTRAVSLEESNRCRGAEHVLVGSNSMKYQTMDKYSAGLFAQSTVRTH